MAKIIIVDDNEIVRDALADMSAFGSIEQAEVIEKAVAKVLDKVTKRYK